MNKKERRKKGLLLTNDQVQLVKVEGVLELKSHFVAIGVKDK